MIEQILFWFLSIVLILSALGTVGMADAVNSVMCLLVAMLALAGLYVLLDAHVVALFQIIIYIGAVMVLFLFIIMLLDLKKTMKLLSLRSFMGGLGVMLVCLVGIIAWLFRHAAVSVTETCGLPAVILTCNIHDIALALFSRHLLVLELTSVLLLVAAIGAIVMTRK